MDILLNSRVDPNAEELQGLVEDCPLWEAIMSDPVVHLGLTSPTALFGASKFEEFCVKKCLKNHVLIHIIMHALTKHRLEVSFHLSVCLLFYKHLISVSSLQHF